ncbi:hypothetical protein [uncultured Gimesia sp.]|uniref:hypothetical protein n=1 Tax=uncultured Gimesia sp. TaxID=1678688 RepID=UPI0030DDB595|tara:strand:+ start:63669 stop:64094 length:426 start_codon:yes stop_codon:yes gene_type:complete
MKPRNLFCLALSLVLILSSGCGSDNSVQGLELKGAVTLDGVPLPTGAITFIPVGQGTSVGATITQGTYQIDSTKGALAGEYKVEIDSSQPTGKKVQSSIGETVEEEFMNLIPEKYNRKSVLKVLITAEGDHIHDFELKSKP